MLRPLTVLFALLAGAALEPTHIAIVGTDYAFLQLPATLAPGPTLFSFENRGTKRHEFSIGLLKQGMSVDSIMRAEPKPNVSARVVTDSIVGLLLARPGERSGGQLYVNLIAGRTYLVVCTLKDTPDAKPHMELGMIGSFTVR